MKCGIAPVQRGPPGTASTPIDRGRRICRLVGIWQCVTNDTFVPGGVAALAVDKRLAVKRSNDTDMGLLTACRQTARRTFRIQRLRPEQESAMLAVLNGRDALVALPTGFGKSLIYQIPAMIFEQPTIVISPLIALMTDQERSLKRAASL